MGRWSLVNGAQHIHTDTAKLIDRTPAGGLLMPRWVRAKTAP